jgi:hypothetical protein
MHKKKYKPAPEMAFLKDWRDERVKVTSGFIETLCGRMIEFFSDPETLMLAEFYDYAGLSRKTIDRWRKQFPLLEETIYRIKQRLSIRREKGMLTGKLRERGIMYMQHQYCEDWKNANEYWAELKKAERGDVDTNTVVVLDHLLKDND